jgi:hypothetical protein
MLRTSRDAKNKSGAGRASGNASCWQRGESGDGLHTLSCSFSRVSRARSCASALAVATADGPSTPTPRAPKLAQWHARHPTDALSPPAMQTATMAFVGKHKHDNVRQIAEPAFGEYLVGRHVAQGARRSMMMRTPVRSTWALQPHFGREAERLQGARLLRTTHTDSCI